MLVKGPHEARQIGMRMSMVLGCDILMQKFSRRARLKVGIIFKRSWLLSRLIQNDAGCLFLGAAIRPFEMLMKGPHIARQVGMKMSMVLGCDILMRRFTRQAWPKA